MPEALAGKRLLIVEEALKDFVGHWYEYVRAVVELSRAGGAEVVVAGHSRAAEPLRSELGVLPVFEKTPWDGVYRHGPAAWRKLGWVRHNALVFRRARAVLTAEGPFDCTFVPTVVLYHIWAWRLLLWLYPRRIGRLVLLVRNAAATYVAGSPQPRFNLAARLFGWGVRSFAADIAAGRVVFATDSDRLAEEYRELCGIVPAVFPSPRIAGPPERKAASDRRAPLTFACLGPARFEKGIDVLQRAIGLYLGNPANPRVRFVIQWPSPISDAEGAPYEADRGLTATGAVEFLTEPLDSTAYEAVLGRTDCMVLPYRRASYFARISGVAVEAVTAGIPVIATADTWTAEFVAGSGAGIAVPDGDAESLAAAMAEIAANFGTFSERAERNRAVAARVHSSEAFLLHLWGVPVSVP